jgi:anhydro-N-acetylmuramic acid kinase
MSGTSLDGVDAVLADMGGAKPVVIGHASLPLPGGLKTELHALQAAGNNELHRAALAGNALARLYATLVQRLLAQCGISAEQVRAVGAHGQTVRHRPREFDGTGYTLQLNQGALLAELCGIDVVADFRSRDVAAGGQGAPLVPPFHQAWFGQTQPSIAVLNIGGISNITVIDAAAHPGLCGFDCGPGNTLLDAWCLLHTGAAYDDRGQWARSGEIHAALLRRLQDEPYFSRTPPKSTGRDLFNMEWLRARLQGLEPLAERDVQATLTELTAWCCSTGLLGLAAHCPTLAVCGGGARNAYLCERIAHALPTCRVCSSEEFGLPPQQVEATAFAWLAHQCVQRKTASRPEVTGASGPRILGTIYPS